MNSIVLTLGHNSSAILVTDGVIIAGYEEERLTGIKSDSRFPYQSILQLLKEGLVEAEGVDSICVSHWFLNKELPNEKDKHWDPIFLREKFPRAEILSLGVMSHHDAHALSAQVFAGSKFAEGQDYHIFVVDGFGSGGECYSVYHCTPGRSAHLVFRRRGFDVSIGLFYQYATDFCGMKMHQHEYKMLGYETHILELIKNSPRVAVLHPFIRQTAYWLIDRIADSMRDHAETDLSELSFVRDNTHRILREFLAVQESYRQDLRSVAFNPQEMRILISYFTQGVTEQVLAALMAQFRPRNLLVVGGTFYNVKLNCLLADMVPGQFCAMPLAGDQGAGLGVYQRYFQNLQWPDNLAWGKRDLADIDGRNIINTCGSEETIEILRNELKTNNMVNLVRGDMEFGPRALCNTSTLAIPDMRVAAEINRINGRTNEMPFALVMNSSQAHERFEDLDKIHRSLEYMIVTRRFTRIPIYLRGGAHYYPLQDEWTCRPQVLDYDPVMSPLLEIFGPLINTSFNVHGQPIVFDRKSILFAHEQQNSIGNIKTVIMR